MSKEGPITPKRLWIVIVEDDDDSRSALSELMTLLGHHVSAASDGVSGRALILKLRPDVALVDLRLPGLSGYELATQVRQFPETAHTRLIAITGSGPETRERALAAGFDVQATKPLDIDVLESLLTESEGVATATRRR